MRNTHSPVLTVRSLLFVIVWLLICYWPTQKKKCFWFIFFRFSEFLLPHSHCRQIGIPEIEAHTLKFMSVYLHDISILNNIFAFVPFIFIQRRDEYWILLRYKRCCCGCCNSALEDMKIEHCALESSFTLFMCFVCVMVRSVWFAFLWFLSAVAV